ncbi:DUF2935 domain-containing protein [Paenibacillus sp. J2TS4]|uniref:DUF2935 domain-containing protein n=1 Tax=Paenibacillus sp. J2TS4 TaxID=2807194 RepID=UPI001B10DABA|nr:DUF2935 domain-containing protein [Paenibacillus sp. J2TS4]GIP33803.1 hypothetical protein J2TS4_30130 [Paenibacillus sp. J2TS4]
MENIIAGERSAEVLFEHRFWLQVLGDHARFIYDSLTAEESKERGAAQYFIRTFDDLLNQARSNLDVNGVLRLNQTAYWRAREIRSYKLHLLERLLMHNIKFHLPPTFVNHMVNEVEEYLRIMQSILTYGKIPEFHAVHLHQLWLLDAVGHAESIKRSLDMVEKRLIAKSGAFAHHFSDFYDKAVEMAGYLRTNLRRFPALSRFNKEVELEMTLFREFLQELEEMDLNAELLGTLQPLMADHMAREECYYLIKLSQVSETHTPDCDPTKPRVE